ncbi:MAG TPA: hypothetical protein VFL57_10355 [Bryobacteraceae bacterium]|nr:hypothetical protein [Bryobacteraceae bacterium]
MLRFVRRRIPPFDRVLLVESGSRELIETLLPGIYKFHPQSHVDLVTCYAGLPASFRADRGCVFRVAAYIGRPARKRLYAELRARRYTVIGIICSGEPVMTKWKWALVWHVPAKVFILNENSDYFWIDRAHLTNIRHFIAFRAGLSGTGAVPAIARLLLFPFTLLYLAGYAAVVHARRHLRLRSAQ